MFKYLYFVFLSKVILMGIKIPHSPMCGFLLVPFLAKLTLMKRQNLCRGSILEKSVG